MFNDNKYKGILLDIGLKIGYYRRRYFYTKKERFPAHLCVVVCGCSP